MSDNQGLDFNKYKVLLVDDDPSLLKLFQYSIVKDGFECKTCNNVEEGFKTAAVFKPDIIVSDIMMPYFTGFDFRKMLLADDSLKDIPFVFLTSKSAEEDILEGYDLGIADFIIKTAGPKVVVAKIKSILQKIEEERKKALLEISNAADNMRVKVVPDESIDIPGFYIKHWHQDFKGIPGGDFIDYFKLDENKYAVILGDVMGKKWSAWYFAIAYAGYVRSAVRAILQNNSDFSSKTVLQAINASIYKDTKINDVFSTLSIVLLDSGTATVKYSGAGDLPLTYFNHATNSATSISSQGLLLGFAEDGEFDEITLNLNTGDAVFLHTDGITESRSPQGTPAGEQFLTNLLQTFPEDSDLVEYIKSRLYEFTGGEFEDDVSVIVIKKN